LALPGLFKIGMTYELKRRLPAYCSTPTKLIYTIITDDPDGLEKKIHKKYQYCRIQGEWFALKEKELNELLSFSTNDIYLKPIIKQAIIDIVSCRECPNKSDFVSLQNYNSVYHCKITSKEIKLNSIPDWCPLDNKET
jgi:hypothetical protein